LDNPGIEAFLAIVRAQNVSKAAEHLHLAQSTVSKRLKVLEKKVGSPLIERGKGIKSIQLTSTGELFLDYAERWASMCREMNSLQSGGSKLALSIGALDSIINSFFPQLYAKLSHHQPQIHLKVITSHSLDLYDLIEQRQVDVAFSLLERTHQGVHVEKCFTETMVVLRTASFHQSPARVYHPNELDSNFELYVRWGPTYQLWHDQWWTPSHSQVHLDSVQLIVSLLRDDHSWAIVPLSIAKKALSQGIFSVSYLSEIPPHRVCYKLTHKYPKATTVESLKIFDHYLSTILQSTFEI